MTEPVSRRPSPHRHVRGALAVLAALAVVACAKRSNDVLTKEDVERIIDERAAKIARDFVLGMKASASPSGSTSAAPRLSAPGESLEFLAKIDALMKDYRPEFTPIDDTTDRFRCVTSSSAKANPAIAKALAASVAHTEKAKAAREKKAEDFYASVYPIGFHYDSEWRTRKTKGSAATFACLEDDDFNDWTKAECDRAFSAKWTVVSPARPALFTYSNSETAPTNPPELMRRMESAGLPLPARFSCRVHDVAEEGDHVFIRCVSSAPLAAIVASGVLPAINVGDVISAPLAAVVGGEDGVLFKRFGGKMSWWSIVAEGPTITVDERASCPSLDDLATASTVASPPAAPPIAAPVAPAKKAAPPLSDADPDRRVIPVRRHGQ